MRFLIDNPLSPDVARDLRRLGHDAIHVRDRGRQRAPDPVVLNLAARERRVLVSADTDFGRILVLQGLRSPSVVQLRKGTERRPAAQPRLIDHWTRVHAAALLAGAVLTIEQVGCRVRRLPIVPPPRRSRSR